MSAAPARVWVPIEQPRPPESVHQGRNKSPQRKAVEDSLRACPAGLSLSQIALRCGIEVDEARRIVINVAAAGDAHNAKPGARGAALYVWGPAPKPVSAQRLASIVSSSERLTYDGRELRPYEGRPGAMDAFLLPSMDGGTSVPRRAPMIIGANPEGSRR